MRDVILGVVCAVLCHLSLDIARALHICIIAYIVVLTWPRAYQFAQWVSDFMMISVGFSVLVVYFKIILINFIKTSIQ